MERDTKCLDFAKRNLVRQVQLGKDVLIETDQAAVIKDRFPKAQYHFLIVPKEDIASVTALTREHLPLLEHMKELAHQIIDTQQQVPSKNFMIGFKFDAFMNRLTMHVISNDFYSETLRRRTHWNSFNTELFLSYQTLYGLLHIVGSIEPMPAAKAEECRNILELCCNQCEFKSKSLLALKSHLFEHWKKREIELKIKQQVEKVTQMLNEAKLEVKLKRDESPSPQEIEQPKSQATSSANKQSNSPNFIPNEAPAKWRKHPSQQPSKLQPSAPSPNVFARHNQYPLPNNQGVNAQYQPQQGNKAFPGQHAHPRYPPHEFRKFNQQSSIGPRPQINRPNLGMNRQLVRTNDNFQKQPNGQYPRLNLQHNNTQAHFNQFKQSPRMNQPCHGGMQSQTQFNQRPQRNQAQYKDFNRPDSLSVQRNQNLQNKENPRPKLSQESQELKSNGNKFPKKPNEDSQSTI